MEHGQRIELVLGPMYSGKSSELLRRVRRHGHAKRTCAIIKFAGDQRYSDEETVATHDRVFMKGIAARELTPLLTDARVADAQVVAIDEGQFFPDVVEFAEACAAAGKIVIVAALDGCFRRKPFGRVLELVPLADSVVKLTAVCHGCAREAAFTKRTVNSQELQLIGGAEAYVPMCRSCFFASDGPGAVPAAVPSSPVVPSKHAATATAMQSPHTPGSSSPTAIACANTPDPAPEAATSSRQLARELSALSLEA